MAASSLLALLDDIASRARRRGAADQGRGQEDRRRAGRRPRAQCAAGRRRQRRPRAAGGVGSGQGLAGQQGDPGAGGAGDQRLRALGGDAAADDRRRVPVLRGLREARAQAAAQHRPRTTPTTPSWSRRWPTRASTWWRSRRTRSRARSAPTSSSRPRSSRSRWARWPRRAFATQVVVLVGIAIADDRRASTAWWPAS